MFLHNCEYLKKNLKKQEIHDLVKHDLYAYFHALRKKCPYSKLFWSEYGHFLRSDNNWIILQIEESSETYCSFSWCYVCSL